jgi:hypothetical protein
MVTLTEQEIKFLEDNRPLYEVVLKSNYCKNYTRDMYNVFSAIHIRYIGTHNYTHWCIDCKILLLKSVYRWYDSNTKQESKVEQEVVTEQPKKRGRKKKIEIK